MQASWTLRPASNSGIIDIDCGTQGTLKLNAGDVLINNKEAATKADIENLSLSVTKQSLQSFGFETIIGYLPSGYGVKTYSVSEQFFPFPTGSKYLAVAQGFLGYIYVSVGTSFDSKFDLTYVHGTAGSLSSLSLISLSQGFVSGVSLSK